MNPLDARRRLLGRNVYKKTVEGNPAIAQGSLARMYPGITMQGWTEQDSTTGAQLFDIDEFLELPLEPFASYGNARVLALTLKPNTNYTLSSNNIGAISGDVNKNRSLYFTTIDDMVIAAQSCAVFDGRPVTKTSDEEGKLKIVLIDRENADPIVNKEKWVMLNEGDTALPYEPYTGGQPSPNPDYPQPITSAGKYDEGTGKYQYTIKISDSEESPTKSQTVTLTSDRPLTKWDKLEKRNGQWGWVYKSAEIVLDGSEDEAWTLYTTSATGVISFYTTLYGGIGAMKSSLCDKYINKNYAWNDESLYGIYTDDTSYPGRKYFRPPSAEIETVEQWKTWLSENPLTVWYETAEETFVPLSESEQEAMNEMYTFRPTTVLSNDCECEMTLTYKTKKSLEVTD